MDSSTLCDNCDKRGVISCYNSQCQCKSNVNGHRCDQCRDGTYNLNYNNPKGCSECFCSGTTRVCTSSRLFREQIPLAIASDELLLTNRIEGDAPQTASIVDVATNTVSVRIRDENTYYWSLPARFLGNQLNSYGGDLLFTVSNDASGEYVHDQDVILNGNGLTLFWIRKNVNERVSICGRTILFLNS